MARILLVEPDRAIRQFIAGILAEFGHDVLACESAVEAGVWVATSPIDVLVTDMLLNAGQGLALSRSCAALGIRTITLTGREFYADQTEAAHPPGLLEKPFRFSDLQRVLNAIDTPQSTSTVARHTNSAA
jgi:DNA-binding NtrC family response regulator